MKLILILASLIICYGNINNNVINKNSILINNNHNKKKNLLSIRSGDVINDTTTSLPTALHLAHCLSGAECLASLNVDSDIGLSTQEVKLRLIQYGYNVMKPKPTKPLWKLVIEQFEDRLVQILLSVATFSGIIALYEHDVHAIAEPVIIMLILLLNAVVGVIQTASASNSLDALKKLQPLYACTLRDGAWVTELPVADLVPGDIIYLRVGNKVPADARIITLKTTTFSTDEGSLTGESTSASKMLDPVDFESGVASKTNMLFSGTVVTNGGCLAVVTNTGMMTEIGKINQSVQEAFEHQMKTPLTEKVDEFGNQLTVIIGIICLSVFAVNIPKISSPIFKSRFQGLVHYAKVSIALGVAAIPEGLPMVITLCLSLGTSRMAKKNVIVRKLSSVETLGCTSVICTDKTGTLTTNQMTAKLLVTFKKGQDKRAISLIEHDIDGVSYEPVGTVHDLQENAMNLAALQDIASICALCNEAELEYKDGAFGRIGEPTEAALKVLVEKLGVGNAFTKSFDPNDLVNQCNNYWSSKYDKLAVLEFSRNRKSMSVLCQTKIGADGNIISLKKRQNRLFVKGAAEMVTARCGYIKLEDGHIIPITDKIRQDLNFKFMSMAGQPLRCLAMAYKEGDSLGELNKLKTSDAAFSCPLLQDPNNFIALEKNLILVGFCGIKDPARPEVADSILKCRKAGIRVMMMTGDSKETAVAIARDVNILEAYDDVNTHAFTGPEFFSLPEDTQEALLKSGNKVFCRTEPKHKQKLIVMLEKLGEITAMTGDGVNDAPALQQSNIGIAMGITGTEVAKGAADMILADDNFATIVTAVEEGRNIYTNMQSFICYLISTNIGEVLVIFIATILGFPEPLSPLHLLFVNLVTDGPPATALGFNPPDPDAMLKKPRAKNEPILTRWLLTRYVLTGLYVAYATLGAFVWWYQSKGVSISQLMNWGKCLTWTGFSPSSKNLERVCDIFTEEKSSPQTMSLSVLVTMELLKALSAVSLDSSMFSIPPWRNRWLLLGVLIPFACHLLILYTPSLASIFNLSPLSWKEWEIVLKFSAPILVVEEVLKALGKMVSTNKLQEQKHIF